MSTSRFPFTPKQATLRMLEQLPDDASYEDIQYELYVIEKIANGVLAIERGEVVSHEEVGQRLSRWLQPTPAVPAK